MTASGRRSRRHGSRRHGSRQGGSRDAEPRRGAVAGAGLIAVALAGGAAVFLAPGGTPGAAAEPALRTFATCAEADAYLAEQHRLAMRGPGVLEGWGGSGAGRADGMAASGASTASAPSAPGDAVGTGATGTTTQEAGVDESARAKARDGLLYLVDGAGLRVLDVTGPAPREVGRLALPSDRPAADAELVLAGDTAVVVSTGYRQPNPEQPSPRRVAPDIAPGAPGAAPEQAPYDAPYDAATSTAVVVDLANPRAPAVLTSLTTPGTTTALRERNGIVSWVSTSVTRPQGLDCTRIARPAEPSGAGLITVRNLDPRAGRRGLGALVTDATAVAAAGEMVYASPERLYVATSPGGWWGAPMPAARDALTPGGGVRTWVHGFAIGQGSTVRYLASGEVEGRLLSRWSMSERDGYLRLATTRWLPPPAVTRSSTGASAGSRPWTATSSAPIDRLPSTDAAVTILTERAGRLTQVGQVTGLGRGEQIKSVRWFDDLGVVVTFRQTDPLYVLDLSDPARPTVQGELKVPGFSSYLHPLGEHRLLGVGSTATDQGRVTGAQVATFDLGRPTSPRRIDVAETPGAWVDLTRDPREFAYLPAARMALVTGHWLMPAPSQTGGPAQALPAPTPGVRGYAVENDGRLRLLGTVEVPGWRPVHLVSIGPDRAAAVGVPNGTEPDFRSTATVTLLRVSDGTLTRTGALAGR